MRTVGQVLKEEREKKFYTLDEVEKVTKIRKELLEALERGEYSKLPPPTFTQGFIKNYGKFLGLDSEKLLAIFRREFAEQRNPPKILDSFTNPVSKKKLHITPPQVIFLVVVSLILSFFTYLWLEYRFLAGAPFLEVNEPSDQEVLEVASVKVAGRTNPEAKVAINDQEVSVDVSGSFSQVIAISQKVNNIKVSATSKFGHSAVVEKTVYLKNAVN